MSEEKLDGVQSDISTFIDDRELWADFDAVDQLSDFVEKSDSPTFTIITFDGPKEVTSQHGTWKKPTGSTMAIRSTSRFEHKRSSARMEAKELKEVTTGSYAVGLSQSVSNQKKPIFLTTCHRAESVTSYLRDVPLTPKDHKHPLTSDPGPSCALSPSPSGPEPIDKQAIRLFYSDTNLSNPLDDAPKLHHVPSNIRLTCDPTQSQMNREAICNLENTTAGNTGQDAGAVLTRTDDNIDDKSENYDKPDNWTKGVPKNRVRTKKRSLVQKDNMEARPVRKKKTVVKRTHARLIVVRPAVDVIDDTQDDSEGELTNDDQNPDTNENRRGKPRRARRRRKFRGARKKLLKIGTCLNLCFRACFRKP